MPGFENPHRIVSDAPEDLWREVLPLRLANTPRKEPESEGQMPKKVQIRSLKIKKARLRASLWKQNLRPFRLAAQPVRALPLKLPT